MKKERFYDFMVTILSSCIVGIFWWFVTVEKKLDQVERNTNEIQKYSESKDEQYKELINALHRIEISLQNKKDRE